MLNPLDLLPRHLPKALNHTLPSKKKNSGNNVFDVCRARREVCDIRLQGDLLHPSSTVAQSDCSSLMHLLVQRWFYAGWPQTVAHPSAHPDSALGSALFKMCLLCRIRDFPPHWKAGNMCVNHTLLVRWSSVRGLHGNSDVTHTELARGRLPHRMTNKWSGERSQPLWMIFWTDWRLRS